MKLISRTLLLISLSLPAGYANAADEVRVAVSSTPLFFATSYIAKEKKFFDEEGLDVSITDVGKGSNVAASVIGGSADIGGMGLANLVSAINSGQPLQAFATSTRGFPNFLVVSKDFEAKTGVGPFAPLEKRIKALEGKTIAVNDLGGSAGDFVRDLLRRGGLSESAVTMINISSAPGRLATLKAGKIDALVGYAPEPETATIEGYGQVLISTATDIPESRNAEYIMWASPQTYIGANKETLAKFSRALQKAADLIKTQPDAARDAYFTQLAAKSNGGSTDPKLAALQWENMSAFFANPVAVSPEAITGGRRYFKVPDTITDQQLIDYSVAK